MLKNLIKGLIAVYIVISLLYFFRTANFNEQDILHSNNLLINAEVNFFNSVSEYTAFFGKNITGGSNDRFEQDMKNKVIINIKWESNATGESGENLYYPPYIILIPPNDNKPISSQWGYVGTNTRVPLIALRSTTVPSEVIQNVLSEVPEFDWEMMASNPFATVVKAKSFGQGMIEVVFMNYNRPNYPEIFQGYFVYYNPITKKGWVKPFEAQLKPLI